MPEDRDSVIERALAALRHNDADGAVALCEGVLAGGNDAEAWSILGAALIEKDPEAGVRALRTAIQMEPTEPRWYLNYGVALQRRGDFAASEAACRQAFERSRGARETLEPWADSLIALGRYRQAAGLLSQALQHGETPRLRRKLSVALAREGDAQGALAALQHANAGRRADVADRLAMANLHMQLQQFEASDRLFTELLNEMPERTDIALAASVLKRSLGAFDSAREILLAAHSVNPDNPDLVAALVEGVATTPPGLAGKAESMTANERLGSRPRRALSFALARYFDLAGDEEKAWTYVSLAHELYEDRVHWEPARYDQQLERALRLYRQVPDCEGAAPVQPIYVIGPPRSGGTLLQVMLAAGPGVVSVGERAALLPWLMPMLETDAAGEMFGRQCMQLRDADIAGMRSQHPDADKFVDKATHHAHVAGLLARLHSNAAFVDCRRDPCDTALSIFFQDFSANFPYSRKLEDIAAYLSFQRTAVARWADAGVPIFVHDHEAFVRSPGEGGQRLFASLGIDWRPEYLETGKRTPAVQTFSSTRVREDVTTAYSGRWRRYREFLGALPELLAGL